MFNKFKFKSNFLKNVLTLVTGTVLSQAIPILISPFLTRIYSPSDFGLFGLYFSITMVMSVFITGRYEMAIILPKKDEDAVNLVALSLIICVSISTISLLIVLFFRNFIAELLSTPEIADWLFFVPISVLFIGLYQTFYYWSNRQSFYKNIAYTRVTRSINSSILSLLFGFTKIKPGGLIVGDTIGQATASFSLFYRCFRKDKHLINSIEKKVIIEQAKRYKQFPKFNVLSGLLEKLSSNIPVFLLTSFYGIAFAGFFSFSQKIISIPVSVIGRSIGDVFRQRANEDFAANGNCKHLYTETFKKLLFIAILPFLLLFLFSPFLFEIVFGNEWELAGRYSQIMTVMFFLQFLSSPLSNMFLVAEKQKLDLLIQIFLFTVVTISFLIGSNLFTEPGPVILIYSIVYSIKYIFELILSFKFSTGKIQHE